MTRLITLTLACLVVPSAGACGQDVGSASPPEDFGVKALTHVMLLVQHGPRIAGSAAELSAAVYIRDQFGALGIDVRVEPFEFESFIVEEATLSACGDEFSPELIGLNPYTDDLDIDAETVFVGPDVGSDNLGTLNLEDRLVITTDPAPFFALMFGGPRAIVYLTADEYETLASRPCSPCQLRVIGGLTEHSSANVVATLGSTDSDAKEVVISAHYDSYRESPGADDNASGIGVLLELARHFVTSGVEPGLRLRFVAFGAEEAGLVGSRAYLDAHAAELANCALLLNLDQVGGPRGPSVEVTGGVSGVPADAVVNRFPASLRNRTWEGTEGRWRLVEPDVIELFMVSNRPEWLSDLITESAAASGGSIIPTGNMGGDSQVFTQAGVVATSIGTSGNVYHRPEDVPEQVVVDQLAVVGNLAAQIASRTLERYSQRANQD